MATGRMKVIKLAALNLTMHPHSAEAYVAMLQRARERRVAGQLRAERFGLVASIAKKGDANGFHAGRLATFLNIDLNAPWLDTLTNEMADEENLRAIVLPKNLKPNLEPVEFLFHAETHHIFIDARRFSPRSVARAFSSLLNQKGVNKSEGLVQVTPVQRRESLAIIFALKLSRLETTITRPNGDSLSAIAKKVQERFKDSNASSMTQILVGKDLVVDEETKATAELALSNGRVTARGRDAQGEVQKESTIDHPVIHEEKFEPAVEDETVVFRRAVRSFAGRVLEKVFRDPGS